MGLFDDLTLDDLAFHRSSPRLVQRYEWPEHRGQDNQPFAIKPGLDYLDPVLFKLQNELARFSYKPGWHARIEAVQPLDPYLGSDYRITISFLAENTRWRGTTVPIRSVHRVPEGLVDLSLDPFAEQHFAGWLASVLLETEHHEQREWLCRDGQIYDDPHRER